MGKEERLVNFVRIIDGLDVAPALSAVDRCADHWVETCGTARLIPLLDAGGARLLETELAPVWALVDAALDAAARRNGDRGALAYARVGLMRPGESVPPHFDGVDGIRERRYQIALRSEEGVVLTVGGEARRPLPGEAWQIDAARVHSVANGSRGDRVTILFDTVAAD